MRERVTYYSEDDLTIGLNLGPAVEVLNVFTPEKGYSLEDLVELFHVNHQGQGDRYLDPYTI